jgi:hypothetical protein
VLFGGGITNRPFLKGILPINLSEFADDGETDDHQEEGTGMDPKLQRKLLGLPEDATDEQVTEALAKLPDDAVIGPPAPPEKETVSTGIVDKDNEGEPLAASDPKIAEVIKLAEASTDPAVKALAELVGGLQKTVLTQGGALALAEAESTVLKLGQPKDGKMLSAGAQELVKAALLNPTQENILKLSEGMIKGGIVAAGETVTRPHEGNPDGMSAVKKFDDLVEAKIKASDGKLDYNTSVELVANEHPQAYAEYRAASYSFVENRT